MRWLLQVAAALAVQVGLAMEIHTVLAVVARVDF
jgi:hypothetical protein